MSSCHYLRSIRVYVVVLWKARCPACSHKELSPFLFALTTAVTSKEYTFFALATAAQLESSPVSHTERATMPHSVQVTNELATPDDFLCRSHGSDSHSISSQLIDTKKKLEECKEKFEDAKDKRKGLFENIRLLKAKNWLPWTERDGLE